MSKNQPFSCFSITFLLYTHNLTKRQPYKHHSKQSKDEEDSLMEYLFITLELLDGISRDGVLPKLPLCPLNSI